MNMRKAQFLKFIFLSALALGLAVVVSQARSVSAAATCSVSAGFSPGSVQQNGNSTLSWNSSGAASLRRQCTNGCGFNEGLNGWLTPNVAGSESTPGGTSCVGATGCVFYCGDPAGGVGSANADLTITAPASACTVSVSWSPTTVSPAGSSNFSWSSTNATGGNAPISMTCDGSFPGSWSLAASGGGPRSPINLTTTCTASCVGPDGATHSNSATVAISAALPTATTDLSSGITPTGAQLNGTVNPNGSNTQYWFEYGTTNGLGNSTTHVNIGSGSSAIQENWTLSGLTPNTTYYYRISASNAAGANNGGTNTFTTPAILPTVATDGTSAVTPTSATLNGTINPNGAPTNYWFEWGLSAGNIPNSTAHTAMGSGGSPLSESATLTGLTPNTTYYFRASALNVVGTQADGIIPFTTLSGTDTCSMSESFNPISAPNGGSSLLSWTSNPATLIGGGKPTVTCTGVGDVNNPAVSNGSHQFSGVSSDITCTMAARDVNGTACTRTITLPVAQAGTVHVQVKDKYGGLIPDAGTCGGGAPCWTVSGRTKGYSYPNGSGSGDLYNVPLDDYYSLSSNNFAGYVYDSINPGPTYLQGVTPPPPPPAPTTCNDPAARNYGGSLPCTYQSPPPPGGGGGGCFIAGTPVLTPNGPRPIETVKLGDVINAYDTEKGIEISSPVTLVEKKEVTELVHLTPHGLPEIVTTPVHRFWTKRGWIEAGNLTDQDKLFTKQGTWTAIDKIWGESLLKPIAVYNLHIKDEVHNYYAGGVLVHNIKLADLLDPGAIFAGIGNLKIADPLGLDAALAGLTPKKAQADVPNITLGVTVRKVVLGAPFSVNPSDLHAGTPWTVSGSTGVSPNAQSITLVKNVTRTSDGGSATWQTANWRGTAINPSNGSFSVSDTFDCTAPPAASGFEGSDYTDVSSVYWDNAFYTPTDGNDVSRDQTRNVWCGGNVTVISSDSAGTPIPITWSVMRKYGPAVGETSSGKTFRADQGNVVFSVTNPPGSYSWGLESGGCGTLPCTEALTSADGTTTFHIIWQFGGPICPGGQTNPSCNAGTCQVGCGSGGSCGNVGGPCGSAAPTLVVSPAFATVPVGNDTAFTAVYDPDGPGPSPSISVTNSATWVSTFPSISTYNPPPNGRFHGVSSGGVTISASYTGSGGPASGNAFLTVSGAVPVCGNGVVESGEACDLGALNGACPATCSSSCTNNNCASPLSVALVVNPSSGPDPLPTTLTATVSGSAVGPINYSFWWDCPNPTTSVAAATAACGALPPPSPGTCVTNSSGAKCNGMASAVQSVPNTYTPAGNYNAKVIVERGAAPSAEKRRAVTVTAPPPGPSTHTECVANSCTIVNGAGLSRCVSNSDCGSSGSPTHSVCDAVSRACVNLAGLGANTCSSDPTCGGGGGATHFECQSNACVIVGGAGSNQCTSVKNPSAECAPPPPPASCNLTASPSVISKGQKSTLNWSCNGVSACTITPGNFSGTSGSAPVTPTSTTVYTLNCDSGTYTIPVTVRVTTLQECNPALENCPK